MLRVKAATSPKTTVSEKPAPKREAVKTALESAKELSVEEASKKAVKINEEAVKKAAKEFLNQVFGAMGMQVSIETAYNASDRELLVSMEGDDMGILIGKRGQTLDSLQYLVSLIVNKNSDGYLRVKLDTENYREKRKKTLETLAKNIKASALCGLGQTAPNPILSTLRYFRDEYIAHVVDKKCPAGVCKKLIQIKINPDICKSCGICAKLCPTTAIRGEKKVPYEIDQSKCLKCGACVEKCPFKAIYKEA